MIQRGEGGRERRDRRGEEERGKNAGGLDLHQMLFLAIEGKKFVSIPVFWVQEDDGPVFHEDFPCDEDHV